MRGLRADIVYGVQLQRRTPAVTASLIAILAVTIAANTIAFSLVERLFLKAPPVRDPGHLTRIYTTFANGPDYFTLSDADLADIRALDAIFAGVVAEAPTAVSFSVAGDAERLWGETVSRDYFAVLGVTPAVGRTFAAGRDADSSDDSVVISYRLWRRAFHLSTRVLDERVLLNGRPCRVAGVAPETFHGMMVGVEPEMWRPAAALRRDDRGARAYFAIGRLQPGVTIEHARGAVGALARRLQESYPATNRGVRFEVIAEADGRVHPSARGGALDLSTALAGVSALLLLLACANIAGILLVRAAARGREIGIRLALGATRRRIVRQLLTESAVLALFAGGAGLVLTWTAVRMLSAVRLPMRVPLSIDVPVDARVLAFSLAVTIVATLLVGAAPAFAASRTDVQALVKREEAGARRGSRARAALVAAQVALALVLLIGGALFLRSLRSAARVDLGFDPSGIVMTSVDVGLQGYPDTDARRFWTRLRDRAEQIPGTEAVSFTSAVPFELNITTVPIRPEGSRSGDNDGWPQIDAVTVDAGYFHTMAVPVLAGRDFDQRDTIDAQPVAVVNDALARRFWPDGGAVGRRLTRRNGDNVVIVGVVRTTKHITLGEAPRPLVYFPLAQRGSSAITLIARGAGSPSSRLRAIGDVVHSLDAAVPLYNVTTMEDHVAVALLPATAAAAVLSAIAAAALVLTSLGLYGSVWETVARRTHEIGIRRALGADDAHVARVVAGQAIRLVVFGAAVGTAIAAAATRFVGSLLYGVASNDAISFAAAPAVLLFVSACAAARPAWRAIRMNPADALRYE